MSERPHSSFRMAASVDGTGDTFLSGADRETLRLEFPGDLWCWRGPSPYHFIWVPDDGCVALRALAPVVSYGWGMIPVRVRVGRAVWESSLFPKDGRYVVPVKDVVRDAALELTIR